MPHAISAALDSDAHLQDVPQARVPAANRQVAAAQDSIELAVHESISAVEAEWRDFEQCADCTAFQSFDWLSTWQRCIGSLNGVVPAIVTGRGPDGRLLFLLPLAVERHGLGRRLTWLGRELGDYNGPMLAPDFAAAVDGRRFALLWRNVLRQLQNRPQLRFDVVHLDKMQAVVGGQANPFIGLGVALHANGAYFTNLGTEWDSFYTSKRSAETRGRERTKSKRLAKQGEVRFVTPADDAGLAAALDALMEQKSKSLDAMGAANIFVRSGYPEFYRAIARRRDLVHVSRLDVGGQIAAANLGMVFRGTYYHILASYTDGELARFSPGTAHLHDLLRYAMSRGCRTFDFTIGDERYKQEWCDGRIALYDHIVPETLRGWAMALRLRAIGSLKRFIKRKPERAEAAYKLRAALGPLRRRIGRA